MISSWSSKVAKIMVIEEKKGCGFNKVFEQSFEEKVYIVDFDLMFNYSVIAMIIEDSATT